MKTFTSFVVFTLICFALSPTAHSVVPAPDGGYPGFTTAEGANALQNLTTGVGNTANGWHSLFANTGGNLNTAIGAGALLLNTGDNNTATGALALLSNSTGGNNTATGSEALVANTTGVENTATGYQALSTNTNGGDNTADGLQALQFNTSGNLNTAIGVLALPANTTGSSNTAIGFEAGVSVTTASNVIAIGVSVGQNVSNSCFIGNIFGTTLPAGTAVFVDGNGQLGTSKSSRRFKQEIKPMERASETLFALKPVTFRYKKEIDPQGKSQFGLVAEDVEKVNPDLVVRDKDGKPYTVRYDAVNAMLLNEFLKEHKAVREQGAIITELKSSAAKQEATIAQQQKQIEALSAVVQQVSEQLERSEPAPQRVLNKE